MSSNPTVWSSLFSDESKTISLYSVDDIQKNASEIYTNHILYDENREFLKNLPEEIRIKKGRFNILIVHGSPRKIDEYLYEDGENLLDIFKEFSENITISGHTHIPYVKKINEKYFISSGSIGKPKHGNPKSTYIIIEVTEEKFECEIQEIDYDHEKMIKDIGVYTEISDKLIPLLREGF